MPTTKKIAAVASYFTSLVNASPKTQEQIASEAGFVSPNMIAMIKTGRAKLPIARIPALAKALDEDPKKMLSTVLEAYQPDLYGVLMTVAPSMLVSAQELRILRALRAAARTGVLR